MTIVAAGLLAGESLADDDHLRGLPPVDLPIEVRMGFNLVNITEVREKEEMLEFDVTIYLDWTDPRLAYALEDSGMPADRTQGDYSAVPARLYQGEFAVLELFEGWRPHIVIPDGIGDECRDRNQARRFRRVPRDVLRAGRGTYGPQALSI